MRATYGAAAMISVTITAPLPVNVLFADTKSVEGAAYGHMIFELPNDEHDAEKVISWLKNSGLTWKEER